MEKHLRDELLRNHSCISYQIRVQLVFRGQAVGPNQVGHAKKSLLGSVHQNHREQHLSRVDDLCYILRPVSDVDKSVNLSVYMLNLIYIPVVDLRVSSNVYCSSWG